MTETTTAPTRTRNPWAYGLAASGALLYVVAIFVAIIPPQHSTTAAGEIVSFPAMFAQYTGVLMVAILATGLIVAGTLTAAQDWARRR